MGTIEERFKKCFKGGQIHMQPLLEEFSVRFDGLSLDDLTYIIQECKNVKQRLLESEKVECYRTTYLIDIGFSDTAYFGSDEEEEGVLKSLAKEQIDKGNLRFTIEKVKLPKEVLEGHIRDRKAWSKV